MKNKNSLLFMLSNGNIDIISTIINSKEPVQFKILRNLTNPKTQKKYSSATIAKGVKELEEKNLIENKIVKTKTKKVVGYSLTEKGIKTFNILKEAEEKYKKLN